MQLVYPAIFTPCDPEPGYAVIVPDLPGCITEGDTLAQAILMAQDAASGWVLGELEEGAPAPTASSLEQLQLEPGQFVSMLVLDMDAYAEKYGKKAVRKNLTIPAWLNTYAERQGINYSKILTEALDAMYRKQYAIPPNQSENALHS